MQLHARREKNAPRQHHPRWIGAFFSRRACNCEYQIFIMTNSIFSFIINLAHKVKINLKIYIFKIMKIGMRVCG